MTTPEDTPVSGNVLTNNATDPDGDNLTVTEFTVSGATYPAGQTATIPNVGTVVVNTDGTYTFTPAPNYSGTVPTITYTVSDGTATVPGTLDISVTSVNSAPVAENDTLSGIVQGSQGTIDVTLNDKDNDGTIARNTVDLIAPANSNATDTDNDGDIDTVEVPGEGKWEVDNTGVLKFTPETGFTGSPTAISYTVKDNEGATSNIATITFTYSTSYPVSGYVYTDVDGSLGGADGTGLAGVSVELRDAGNNVVSTVTTDADGLYSFPNVAAGSYNVVVVPPTGMHNVSTSESPVQSDGVIAVTITDAGVSGQNFGLGTPPVTAADTQSVAAGTATVTIKVLDNDTDAENNINASTVSLVAPAGVTVTDVVVDARGDTTSFKVSGQGLWSVSETGEVSFTPEAGYSAEPTAVSYRVEDNSGLVSNVSEIRVTYIAVPDLTVRITTTPNNINKTSDIVILVRVSEVNNTAANGSDIVVYVDKNNLVGNYNFDPSSTITGVTPVQNSLFTVDFTSDPDYIIIRASGLVLKGNSRQLYFSGTCTITSGMSGTANINAYLISGSGGEVNDKNNTSTSTIKYLVQ